MRTDTDGFMNTEMPVFMEKTRALKDWIWRIPNTVERWIRSVTFTGARDIIMLTLQRAEELNCSMVTEKHLLLHARNVSYAMGVFARYFGEDVEHWQAVGLLFRRGRFRDSISSFRPGRGQLQC